MRFLVPLFLLAFMVFPAKAQLSNQYRAIDGTLSPGMAYRTNYLKNPEFEKTKGIGITDTSGITALQNTPTIYGANSLRITATVGTEIVKFNSWPIDLKLFGQNCVASYYYRGYGATYKSYVSDGTNVVSAVEFLEDTDIDTRTRKVDMYFPCSTLGASYSIVIEAYSTFGSIYVDSAFVGEAGLLTSSVQTSWQQYLPTVSGFTITASRLVWRRDGPDLLIKGSFDMVSATGSPGQIYFPTSGMVVAPNVGTVNPDLAGKIIASQDLNVQTDGQAVMSAGNNYVLITRRLASNTDNPYGTAGMNALYGNGTISVDLRIPISGWTPLTAINASNANTDWIDGGAVPITSTGTGPTKGTTSSDHFYWKRDNGNLIARIAYVQTGGGSAGTGLYKFGIPGAVGCQVDTTKVTAFTGTDMASLPNVVGNGVVGLPALAAGMSDVYVYDSANIAIASSSSNTAGYYAVGATTNAGGDWYGIGNTAVNYAATFTVPCANWPNAQNAPQLIGSVITSTTGGILKTFHLQYGNGASFATATTCSTVGNCDIFDSTAPIGSSVEGFNSGTYLMHVPAGYCNGPLYCDMKGLQPFQLNWCTPNQGVGGAFVPPTSTTVSFSCTNTAGAILTLGIVKCECTF